MYAVMEEVDRKIEVLGSSFDTDIIYQITQMAEVNGVDSDFVKDFMEYLVEKIAQVIFVVFIKCRYHQIMFCQFYTYMTQY